MIFLRKASGIGFYTEKKATTLEFKKKAVMLTGHNGSGKTSFLLGLYNTIGSINERHPQTLALMGSRSWGFEIEIEDDLFYEKYKEEFTKLFIPKKQLKINVRHIACESNNSLLDQTKIQAYVATDPIKKSLENSFIEFKNKINNSDRTVHGNFYSLPKDDSERIEVSMMRLNFTTDHRTAAIQTKYRDEIKNNTNYLPCVLLINEQIYFNTSNNEPKSLKLYNNEANNLDKTTYLVLNQLSKEILKGGNNHKDYLNDLFSKEKDLNKIKKEIENLLSNKQYTKDINDLILKLNTFLNLTGKSAHISEDGFIFLKEGEKTVNWYQCSKGEKNLIVLIVLAFLNKNNNTIFILDEPDLSMHIEWQELLIPTLLEICPNNQFFISMVDSASDGCQKLQELSEQYELGDNLIICLDSDFSYIRSVLNFTEDSHDRDYIFETYSHSIENAKYYEDFIVESISRYISEDPHSEKFNFIYEYYREISKAIFYPFVKTLILRNLENKAITAEDNIMKILNDFKGISFNKTYSCKDFLNNPKWISVKESLSRLNILLDTEISSKGIDFNLVLDKLSQNNINEDNIYLFVRGHDLAAMLHKHIISFYESLFNEKCDEICNGHTDGKLKGECKAQFFNNKPSFSLTERKDLSKHPFMSKTVSRISMMFTNSLT